LVLKNFLPSGFYVVFFFGFVRCHPFGVFASFYGFGKMIDI